MLALQRPSMGSSKPPNLDMPFGYSFDTSPSNFPFPSPTAPAPGPSLLDDNESKLLDSFFDGVNSDHFNYDFFTNAADGSDLGLGWDELPPTFMGTTSSFGQQPQLTSHGLPPMNFSDINSHVGMIPPLTSPHVLPPAQLIQNGSASRSHSMGNEGLFRPQHISMPHANGRIRQPSMPQYPSTRPNTSIQERPQEDGYMRDTFYTDMVFGTHGTMRPRPVSQNGDLRWGSDVGFNSSQGFVAPTIQDKIAASERSHMQSVESAFIEEPQDASSADSTRPSTPTHQLAILPPRRTRSDDCAKDEEDQDSRPLKRRKSKLPEEAEEEEDSAVSSSHQYGSKKRKPVKKGTSSHSPAGSSDHAHKRRKSGSAAANASIKPSRENLTEDQKRENHIKSEQKRRTLIREGFEDLGELVPGLRGGGFSKSAVLIMAADWLEELIQGNEVLQRRLHSMQGRR